MPAWWVRKFSKNKEQHNHHHHHPTSFLNFSKSSSPKTEPKTVSDRPRSFDEVAAVIFSRNSPRSSRDLGSSGGGASSGFSGFDSNSGDESHPLPRPNTSVLGIDHGVGTGSGSASVSSVSSSGSSDDHPSAHEQLQFGGSRWVSYSEGFWFGFGAYL